MVVITEASESPTRGPKEIVITMFPKALRASMFSCGIPQTILCTAYMMVKIGYKVTFLMTEGTDLEEERKVMIEGAREEYRKILEQIAMQKIQEVGKEKRVDLLILQGTWVDSRFVMFLKSKWNTKVVYTALCNLGGSLLPELMFYPKQFEEPEKFLPVQFGFVYDQIWVLQQFQEHSAADILQELFKCKNIAHVPQAWMPVYIPKNIPLEGSKKCICVIEPNISVVKNCLIPLFILNKLFEEDPNAYDVAYILNGQHVGENKLVKERLTLYLPALRASNKKVMFMNRLPPFIVHNKLATVVLSWQTRVDINNAYLETLHLRLPWVHNSDYFKDAGYYYEGSNIEQGVRALRAALNHEANDLYDARCLDALRRHHPNTPTVKHLYKNLVDTLCD